jgi:hypothetical protein
LGFGAGGRSHEYTYKVPFTFWRGVVSYWDLPLGIFIMTEGKTFFIFSLCLPVGARYAISLVLVVPTKSQEFWIRQRHWEYLVIQFPSSIDDQSRQNSDFFKATLSQHWHLGRIPGISLLHFHQGEVIWNLASFCIRKKSVTHAQLQG